MNIEDVKFVQNFLSNKNNCYSELFTNSSIEISKKQTIVKSKGFSIANEGIRFGSDYLKASELDFNAIRER